MGFGGEYRIDFFKDDETLSFVMVLRARADNDARDEAERMMFKGGLVRAEIWRDDVRVCTVDQRTAVPSVMSEWVPFQWRIEF